MVVYSRYRKKFSWNGDKLTFVNALHIKFLFFRNNFSEEDFETDNNVNWWLVPGTVSDG